MRVADTIDSQKSEDRDITDKKSEVKLSRYTPWRHMWGEEV
jgi:hypothetical protein